MTRGSALFACALACGIVLRLLWPADMEWKADEQRMFAWASAIGVTEPWPSVGMASGVAIPNPGLSVWIFVPLARVAGDPVALAQIVQLVNVVALIGFAVFGASRAFTAPARQLWFAGLALMSVNPIAIVLARKIWAQSLLPVFTVATLAAHAGRRSWAGAFIWGLVGALTGQIHMSGFFLQAALVLFTGASTLRWKPRASPEASSVASASFPSSVASAFRRKDPNENASRTRWSAWALGSALGAIPLWPWALDLLRSESHFARDWMATLVPRAPYTWLVDSLGIDTPYVYRPASLWFLAEPRIGGVPTYGMAVAHAALLGIGLYCLVRWVKTIRRPQIVSPREEGNLWLWIHAAAFGMTALLMLAGVRARTHYLVIAYPLPFVWLAWLLLTYGGARLYRMALGLQLAITITLMLQVHRDGGVSNGAYGLSYSAQTDQSLETP
jgi:hypothetical protein